MVHGIRRLEPWMLRVDNSPCWVIAMAHRMSPLRHFSLNNSQLLCLSCRSSSNVCSISSCPSGNWVVRSSLQQGDAAGGGHKNVQEALVEMVRLQKGEVVVTEFVKEKSKVLTEIAESANEEYDRIADDVRRGMDEAGSKVIESMEADVGELEKELASARAKIEAEEREFEEFEKNVVKARNEGLYFKSLFQRLRTSKSRSPQEQEEIKNEARMVIETAKKSAKSSSRNTVYAALAILLALTIVEAIASGESWQKVGIYSGLLVFLLLQTIYEKSFVNQNKVEKPKDE